ncbi:hypothetical protein TRFO_32470 [Tritrichomonas foetus]|uniref:Leucine Rich Repeat family protein n=1 Tax=Tritrichomonas foetus TaxID=1144522 RepID=A0A1J4JTB6_9EUKA|nr:hypothetical protein TRFO_32470 [Tritrichomonas foetus]|eukprot:OHT00740.1 hypothetical protein TRFO_32470 [Tritrichomonas foetus]
MLSLDDFKSISNAHDGRFHFDLSVINKELIGPILRSIETFGANEFELLTISCLKLAQLDEDEEYPQYIIDSIAVNVPQYFKYFFKTLVTLLSTSRQLKEIHFLCLKLDEEDLINTCKAIRQSQSLKLVDFTDIPIGNKIIKEMTYHVSFNSEIQYIYFRRCDLTNDSIPILVNYVSAIRKRFGEEGLLEIDLSDNDISPDEFQKVIEALNNFQTEDCPEERLMKENELLRDEIIKWKEIVREVKENGKLFIMGEGSREIIKLMRSIDDRISILEK